MACTCFFLLSGWQRGRIDGVLRFDAWIRYVDNYEGNDLLYLSPRGIIPETAVVKKDVKRRPKPFRESRRFDVTNIKQFQDAPPLEEESESEEETISKPALEDMEG